MHRIVWKTAVLLMTSLCLFSCGKDDIIEEDATRLPDNAQGVSVVSGRNRALLSFIIKSPDVKKCEVFWNNRNSSKLIDITAGSTDTIKTLIEDLAEGNHSFEVTSYDEQNNSSTIIVKGKVYGDRYINSLKNRQIKELTYIEGDEPFIEWSSPTAGEEVGIRLTYQHQDGQLRQLIIPREEAITELTSYKENTAVSYSSMYVPEPGCLDTFYRAASAMPAFQKEPADIAFTTRFVGPEATGNGDGNSIANAADFLDDSFWSGINALLAKGTVSIKFVAGNYTRAYSEKPLTLNRIGHNTNRLTLQGDGAKTIFIASAGLGEKAVMIMIRDSKNIRMKNFNFTGNGSLQYALRIYGTPNSANLAKDILIENCNWTDMRGIIYGATGAHYNGAQHITYKNCKFKRIGVDHRSHMIYNAYGSTYVSILNCQFEDCTGDFVRFRDKCDYGMVKNSTFIRNPAFQNRFKFISMPLYNDVDPGNETFATNYAFTNNVFINASNAMEFYHDGFSPAGYSYLLTKEEGTILETGTIPAKKALLNANFGINTEKVRMHGNQYTNIGERFTFTSVPMYGAVSKGWASTVNIANLFDENSAPFSWEKAQ